MSRLLPACLLVASVLAGATGPCRADAWTLDAGFGAGGLQTADFLGPDDEAAVAVEVLPDGRYYALGRSLDQTRLSRHLANGALDPSFGDQGSTRVDGFYGYLLALQADGRIIVGGTAGTTTLENDFALARFSTAGQLDTTFGTGGVTRTDFAQHADVANAMVIEAGGSILLAGRAFIAAAGGGNVALARYDSNGALLLTRATKLYQGTVDVIDEIHLLADGRLLGTGTTGSFQFSASIALRFHANLQLDTSFADAGVAFIGLGERDNESYASALQPDGAIVLAGWIDRGGNNQSVLLVRLLANGSLDPGFGNGGWTETIIPGDADPIAVHLLLDAGRILVAVATIQVQDFVIARYTAAGQPDLAFGVGGLLIQDFHGGRDAIAVIELHSGGLLAAGRAEPATGGPGGNLGFARYSLEGVLDGSFGSGGLADTGFQAPVANRARAVAVQADGRILAAGYAGSSGPRDFALSRHLQTGALDPGFGDGGRVKLDVAGGEDDATAVLAQPDGTILVAGVAAVGPQRRFGIVRLLGNGQPDPAFGTAGRVLVDVGTPGSGPLRLARRPDGRILVAGTALGTGGTFDFAVVALTAAGAVDTSFGVAGKAVVDMAGGSDFATSILLRPDGSILLAGNATWPGTGLDMQVVRLLAGGAIDTSFGTGGKVRIDFAGRTDTAQAMVLVGAGASERLYVAGSAQLTTSALSTDFAVAALDGTGALVPGFGTGGKATADLGAGTPDTAFAILALAQRLVLVGSGPQGIGSDVQLLALGFDGAPDPGFSATGAQLAVDSGGQDEAAAAIVDGQGRMLVAGWTYAGGGQGGQDFLLARLAPVVDGIFGNGFEAP
jgi:uncharacterized delta-60 repeat protein